MEYTPRRKLTREFKLEAVRQVALSEKKLPVSAVSYRYLQQIADLRLAEEWKRPDMPVLVIYGTTDPTTDESESRYLVDMINSFTRGARPTCRSKA